MIGSSTHSYPKSARLRAAPEFQAAFQSGLKHSGVFFRLHFLAHPGGRLEPAEVRLDPSARPQADRIPGVSGGAAIDGAAAVRGVLRDVRGDTRCPAAGYEVGGVVPLVRGERSSSPTA